MKKIIINTKEWGVYLGCCMGLGFWSKLDSVGQDVACVFDSIKDAKEHINSWDEIPSFEFQYLEVNSLNGEYATIKECMEAGAEAWNPLDERDLPYETIH